MRAFRLRGVLPALLLLAIGPGSADAAARGADEYFHGSAHKFVAGRLQEAAIEAEEGLRKFPDDAALKGLAAHLRRLKDQQKKDQGDQGSSQGDQGDKQQDRKDDQKAEGGEKGGEAEKKEERKDPGEDDRKGPEGQDTAQAGEAGDKEGKDSTGEAMAPVKPGEMSREDAERLLNSVQDDEKKEHRQMQRRHRKKVEVEQDW